VVTIERADAQRFGALEKNCDKLIIPGFAHINCDHLFHCGAGKGDCYITYDGFFRLCSALAHPKCVYDLKKGALQQAWQDFTPKVVHMRSSREAFLNRCRKCELINLCMWCPAHAHLETGALDKPVEFFCKLAHARAGALRKRAD